MKSKQLTMLKNQTLAYGGELMKTRKGRSTPRFLSTKESMHLVFRSSKAKGELSFKKWANEKKIRIIFFKFAKRHGITIYSLANVGIHLHLHLKLTNRHTYPKFIRATTSAIAMAIMGKEFWQTKEGQKFKFWDYRPFSRVIRGYKALLGLRDYIKINVYEGYGYKREDARFIVKANANIDFRFTG